MSSDVARMFTRRAAAYGRFIRSAFYPQGLRAFFLEAPFLRSGLRVLDAGCGTGVVALGYLDALAHRGLTPGPLHAFDLTAAMLDRFRAQLRARGRTDVELAQADVLHLQDLPAAWGGYDLVLSASMLEYLRRDRFADALRGLRGLLAADGHLVLFITRRSWLMQLLIGWWWASTLYSRAELEEAFTAAGFRTVGFARFPLRFRHLDAWGHIVVAR